MYTFVFELYGSILKVKGDSLRVSDTGAINVLIGSKIVAVIPQGIYVVAEEVEVK